MPSGCQHDSPQMLGSTHTEAELSLRQSEAKFRALAETTHAIIFINQGNQLCYVNPAAEAITGYCREELLSCPNIQALIQAQGEISCQRVESQKEVTHRQEIKILTKAGQDCWLDCAIGVIEFNGKLATIGTATDITQRKQAEAELQKALAHTQALSDLRAQFLRVISHEFRSPLNDIEIAVSALTRYRNCWTEADQTSCLEGIERDIQQLTHRLDEVLSISRAKVFHAYSQARPLDLHQFLSRTIGELECRDHHKHSFSICVQGQSNPVFINQPLLQLILTNLLSNALKYSPNGEVIEVHANSRAAYLELKVKDHGIGISTADQAQLFKPFMRSKNVEPIPGIGLGLTIVKRLIDFYGGTIDCTSEVNVGTSFRVTLPAGNAMR